VRVAKSSDAPEIERLMEQAILQLLPAFLGPEQIAASFQAMGLDTQLIEDGTYFLVHDGELLVACGGWSQRATLYGGNHTPGRDARLLDPGNEAARIRAMYTHPGYARRGLGRLVLRVSEDAARAEGFTRVVLGATLGGEPLYRACGYRETGRHTEGGVPLVQMEKALDASNRV
jgi:GNAT superfamily N-acetyltransferase